MTHVETISGRLDDFLERHPRLFVLTGAGISVDSGVPAYRDEAGNWLYRRPIQHQEFLQQDRVRKRYWARSLAGWPTVRDAGPNDAHRALAALETAGHVEMLVTQNVDRLHQRAGSERVIDLHGRLDRVRCLDCDAILERETVQDMLRRDNPKVSGLAAAPRPDGDRDLPDEQLAGFRLPTCTRCYGTLKPDVVFFGGSIPRARIDSCLLALERADALIAIGTSLQVYSGYRFCRQAAARGKPIAIVNPGRTRADDMAQLKIELPAALALPRPPV